MHILCYDIWFYITHILLHHKNCSYIHKIHHTKPYKQLTYEDAYVAHYIENIVQISGIFIPYIFISKSEFSLFKLFIAFELISLRGLLRHDNRFSWLIGNHHLLHHKYPNYNFGEYWIDKLCNTNYPNEEEYIYGKIYT